MRIGSLFSGIGGLELGLEWAGLGEVVWQVESDPFCRSVLAQHWPYVRRFEDVRNVGAANLGDADLICGGFPCQDISAAGKGAGLAGDRSGLWLEFARIINELGPRWVVVENVASGANRWIDPVCSHLAKLGYEALPIPLSAQDVGAPHIRRRVFIIAHSHGDPLRKQSRRQDGADREFAPKPSVAGEEGDTPNADRVGRPVKNDAPGSVEAIGEAACGGCADPWRCGPPVSPVCGVDDGIPNRVDRIRSLGNAVVPQCAEVIGEMIAILERGES